MLAAASSGQVAGLCFPRRAPSPSPPPPPPPLLNRRRGPLHRRPAALLPRARTFLRRPAAATPPRAAAPDPPPPSPADSAVSPRLPAFSLSLSLHLCLFSGDPIPLVCFFYLPAPRRAPRAAEAGENVNFVRISQWELHATSSGKPGKLRRRAIQAGRPEVQYPRCGDPYLAMLASPFFLPPASNRLFAFRGAN
jgi:hypothetical protein